MREIPLSQGLVALVDDEDYDQASMHQWYAARVNGSIYAQRSARLPNGGQVTQKIHTHLTGWPLVDHINGNGLDNRRSNLRPATKAENNRNKRRYRNSTSGFKGVSQRGNGRWRAYIYVNGRRVGLGDHATAEAAARAYDAAAPVHHGEFARLNMPRLAATLAAGMPGPSVAAATCAP
jgi:hypothetical protein